MNDKELRKELRSFVNRYNLENGSDTPDYILANYLYDCLQAFDDATKARTEWYAHDSLMKKITTTMSAGAVLTEGD